MSPRTTPFVKRGICIEGIIIIYSGIMSLDLVQEDNTVKLLEYLYSNCAFGMYHCSIDT